MAGLAAMTLVSELLGGAEGVLESAEDMNKHLKGKWGKENKYSIDAIEARLKRVASGDGAAIDPSNLELDQLLLQVSQKYGPKQRNKFMHAFKSLYTRNAERLEKWFKVSGKAISVGSAVATIMVAALSVETLGISVVAAVVVVACAMALSAGVEFYRQFYALPKAKKEKAAEKVAAENNKPSIVEILEKHHSDRLKAAGA